MPTICILCKKKNGKPNFCNECRGKPFEERFVAIKKKRNFHSGSGFGRPKYGSRMMQDKFGEEEGYTTTKAENAEN